MHSAWDDKLGLSRLENLGIDPPDVPLPAHLIEMVEDEGVDFVDIIRGHAIEVLTMDSLRDR
eukprot:11887986-Heterocapsa_arctica.AAC.1